MNTYYLNKAEEYLPKLIQTEVLPDRSEAILENGESVVLDLGAHCVGYFSFRMWWVDQYLDAPVRVAIRFCETAKELDDDYHQYRGGLCSSWLPEDIFTLDFPGEYKLPRRYAARYIKIRVINAPFLKIRFSDFCFLAQTSADPTKCKPLGDDADEIFQRIDTVAANTLKSCMQRIFEDGPKRDRRLWIGDLRLQALTNYFTFDNLDLVKRCLYLFAAADCNEHGFLPAYVYENPVFVSGYWYIKDYSLMYVCSLCDYLEHTNDTETVLDLYPVAQSVMEAMNETLDRHGILTDIGADFFVDWSVDLKRRIAAHGIYLYTLNKWCRLLGCLGKTDVQAVFGDRLKAGKDAAIRQFYNQGKNRFEERDGDGQHSVHATVWMVLGGVIEGKLAGDALLRELNDTESIQPVTPYMHHYTVEALITAGLRREAEEYLRKIWGGMVLLGVDTFWEAYVPQNPEFSPYGDRMVNSSCHAWSCTPAYWIRAHSLGIKK